MSLLNEYTFLNDQLIVYFDFQGDSASRINDKSESGKNDGIIVNQAQLEDISPENRVMTFNHSGDYLRIANATEINGSILPKRTISLAFQVEDVNISDRKQVLYEEGGRGAGLNIYIHAGRLYVGGWNNARWQATFLSTDKLTAGKWHHVSLVLDATLGSTTLQAGAFRGYLDGVQFGEGQGLELGAHLGGIGLGNVNIDTRFHDGTFQGTGNHVFAGSIDEVLLHNRALQSSEIAKLADSVPKPMPWGQTYSPLPIGLPNSLF
jgi:hypothetical protein